MEDYLLDRETLGKFVDELMKKRPLPVDNAEELANFKEEQIKALDDRIARAIFGGLNESQTSELQSLLDKESENPDVFRDFFQNHNINLEQTISDALSAFSADFLKGGQNVA